MTTSHRQTIDRLHRQIAGARARRDAFRAGSTNEAAVRQELAHLLRCLDTARAQERQERHSAALSARETSALVLAAAESGTLALAATAKLLEESGARARRARRIGTAHRAV